jgi:hypothetical protein
MRCEIALGIHAPRRERAIPKLLHLRGRLSTIGREERRQEPLVPQRRLGAHGDDGIHGKEVWAAQPVIPEGAIWDQVLPVERTQGLPPSRHHIPARQSASGHLARA